MTTAETLAGLIARQDVPRRVRREAEDLLEAVRANVVISPRRLHALLDVVRAEEPCSHLGLGGTCAWLRAHGRAEGLPVPPLGEPAHCVFLDRYSECTGFRRRS